MEEKKTAPVTSSNSKQGPANMQTDDNTKKENISFKEKPETALDKIKNYVLNGGNDAEKYLSLYQSLSDKEKKEFNSDGLSTVIFRSVIDTSKNLNTLLKVTPLFSYPNDEKHAEDNKNIKKYAENLNAAIEKVENTAIKTYQNYEYRKNIDNLISCLSDVTAPTEKWQKETKEVLPYLEKELKKEEYNGATPEDVLIYFNVLGAFLPDVLGENDSQSENNDIDQAPTDGKHKITPQQARKAWENAKESKKLYDLLPQLVSTGTPKYYTSPNTALTNALQQGTSKAKEIIDGKPHDVPVMNVGKSNEVTIYVTANFENAGGITLKGKHFTEYDRAVHDAASSIYMDRIKDNMPPVMTAEMIYKAMTHKSDSDSVSPQQKASITKSMDKMAFHIHVTADVTDEYRKRGLPVDDKKGVVFDGNMISAKKITMKAGGKEIEAYKLYDMPMLLEYAKLTNQQITVKGDLLDIKKIDKNHHITPVSISNNEKRISARNYLLRRIEIMKNDKKKAMDSLRKYETERKKDETLPVKQLKEFMKQRHTILFKSLFNDIDISDNSERIKNYCYLVLDYWTAKGHIKGYKKKKKGKYVEAVDILI